MKKINTKSLMIFTILFVSIGSMPIAVNGEAKNTNDVFAFDQVDAGIFDEFRGGFGALFGSLGYAGAILGSVFETLFLQGLDLNSHETLKNVYVLSANTTQDISGTRDFSGGVKEHYYFPSDYVTPDNDGLAYCEVTKTGSYAFDLEIGAAVTLVIWDSDKSFINAVNKLLNFFKKVIYYKDVLDRELPLDLIREGISVLTWFLIHINDIFTGDELFILNPITWQKLNINPVGYTIDKSYWLTGSDYAIGGGDDIALNASTIADWNNTAITSKDSYVEWLLTPTLSGDLVSTLWTQFSFDLIQLWVKNFEIHIDVSEILDAAMGSGIGTLEQQMASAFSGCDIEFYLFTHHLAGAFLYDDTGDNRISADYVNVTDNADQPVLDADGDPVQIPQSSELTHRLILGDVEDFIFSKPVINSGDKSISWGLTLNNASISAVPMFVDLDSYLNAPVETLDYIYFGFTFIPTKDPDLGVAKGIIKLDQFFAPWNGGDGPNANIAGLDLAIIYVSTVLYFHLNVAVNELPDDPEVLLDPKEDYNESSNELKVGNYIGGEASQKLDFVDIAGPYYEYGLNRSAAIQYNATTNIMPLLVWTWEMERHDTFELGNGSTSQTFASDIRISTEFDVMVYAVCYPEFNGLGYGVWHDPTFSVYMVFQSEGFWALIVLIAGIGLVGVATVLIKRKKDSRF